VSLELDGVDLWSLEEPHAALGDPSHPGSSPIIGLDLVLDFDLLTHFRQHAAIQVADVDVAPFGDQHDPEDPARGHGADDNSGGASR
jgi:hypothetical protein